MLTQYQIDILMRARDLISNGWTKGKFARSSSGTPVHVMTDGDYGACKFCIQGAILRSYGESAGFSSHKFDNELNAAAYCDLRMKDLHDHIAKCFGSFGYMINFNDYHATTKQDIIDLIDGLLDDGTVQYERVD